VPADNLGVLGPGAPGLVRGQAVQLGGFGRAGGADVSHGLATITAEQGGRVQRIDPEARHGVILLSFFWFQVSGRQVAGCKGLWLLT
jgi:hypothetical protein